MSINNFDVNAAARKDSGVFGLPFSVEESELVLIPVPWEVTTSYGGGTSRGPDAILQASKQVDLFDADKGDFFKKGIAILDESADVHAWNDAGRMLAQKIIAQEDDVTDEMFGKINAYSDQLNQYVYAETKRLLSSGKKVGVVGGDHSVPFGAILAFLEKYPKMGVLHFDAHADMRNAYEGFEHSHASIMHNIIAKTSLQKLVQVGIRDFCEEEADLIKAHPERIKTFFDADLSDAKMQGESWDSLCDKIVAALPKEVYVSFDIDGLDPRFCPNTGTPVPGGLDWREALYLLKKVARSGRQIIGFDLNEVSPGLSESEWDANVGARLLYQLCGWVLT